MSNSGNLPTNLELEHEKPYPDSRVFTVCIKGKIASKPGMLGHGGARRETSSGDSTSVTDWPDQPHLASVKQRPWPRTLLVPVSRVLWRPFGAISQPPTPHLRFPHTPRKPRPPYHAVGAQIVSHRSRKTAIPQDSPSCR